MKKVPLTIETSYLPEWGLWEGVRELMQNGKDAETDFGAPLIIKHDGETLTITNEGATLPHRCLLMGNTSKRGKNLIGQFGEGLKLGMLALARVKRFPKILTGGEVWTPVLEWDSNFGAEILCVEIDESEDLIERVVVQIPLSTEEWQTFQQRFAFLSIAKENKIPTPRGDLLLGDDLRGRLYVKGIFVNYDENLEYGYDYVDVSINRDRKVVADFDRKWENANIWTDAVRNHPDKLGDIFFDLLQSGSEDLSGMDSEYQAKALPPKILDMVVEKFVKKYGEGSIPVENIEQSMQLEHLGRRGVVVSKSLRTVIQQRVGSVEQVIHSLQKEVVHTFSWGELNETERFNLLLSVELVTKAMAVALKTPPINLLSLVSVVEFRSPGLSGQFKDGKIFLANKILVDREDTLATLIHEIAHVNGGDGAHGHVSLLETLWKAVVGVLIDGEEFSYVRQRARDLGTRNSALENSPPRTNQEMGSPPTSKELHQEVARET